MSHPPPHPRLLALLKFSSSLADAAIEATKLAHKTIKTRLRQPRSATLRPGTPLWNELVLEA
ncbi:MAG: hypothetical protein KGJ37_05385 [Verrucomicrobiota bacterium]|nr:hypothetical protein [Verrucomicrobiota bacterium]